MGEKKEEKEKTARNDKEKQKSEMIKNHSLAKTLYCIFLSFLSLKSLIYLVAGVQKKYMLS